MISGFGVKNRRFKGTHDGFSLTGILLRSVVLVMAAVFMAVQVLGMFPEPVPLSFAQRMDIGNLTREAARHLPLFLLWIGFMIAGILVALRLGLRSLRRISKLAADIGPATISQRLPLKATPREIAPLVIAFNSALDRLEEGLCAQREFSANAAHELRTPLATLRAQVENALAPSERADVIEELERLDRLITQLLTLAAVDNGEVLNAVSFDLVDLARSLASDMAGTILASGRAIAFESFHERWTYQGTPGLVKVAIGNLIENAIRHTTPGCEIIVSVDRAGRVSVTDDGTGVPPGFQHRLFQRFSKADTNSFGAGLGLSIVSHIMALHGGVARLDPSPAGARFTLDFSSRGATA